LTTAIDAGAEVLDVKVCPHCAEELPDEATVCSRCRKDPAVAPAWAVAKRSEAPPVGLWWDDSEDTWEPNRVPDPMDEHPGLYESLEPAAAHEPEIPRIVWAALALTLFGGGIITGLVLGIIARRQIKSSNGRLGGLALANIAIALNLVTLIYVVFVIGPALWRALMT
jgi:ribosomal protein L40E